MEKSEGKNWTRREFLKDRWGNYGSRGRHHGFPGDPEVCVGGDADQDRHPCELERNSVPSGNRVPGWLHPG